MSWGESRKHDNTAEHLFIKVYIILRKKYFIFPLRQQKEKKGLV
jgi:hypothetical protein